MKYRFWVETKSGEVVSWTGLTLMQARLMNGQAERHVSWVNTNAFGWEKE